MVRPWMEKRDSEVYDLWAAGETPKAIMLALRMTRNQVYKGLERMRKQMMSKPKSDKRRKKEKDKPRQKGGRLLK